MRALRSSCLASVCLLVLLGLPPALAGAIPTVQLADQGAGRVDMPIIALGTGGYDNDTAAAAVATAGKLGLYHVHAAYDYHNLPGVARGLASIPAEHRFITAMTPPCVHTAAYPVRRVTDPNACFELTLREVNETLARLGVDHVDLLMPHGPSENFGYESGCNASVCALNRAQWRAYSQVFAEGRARALGVSNYCQSCLECLTTPESPQGNLPRPVVNQIQLHVGMGRDSEGLFSFCAKEGIVVQAYSPLAAGGVVTSATCGRIGRSHNRSAAQVGLRWVLQHDTSAPTALVVKADKTTYLEEDLDIFSWSLSSEEMAALDAETQPRGQQDGRPSWGCAK